MTAPTLWKGNVGSRVGYSLITVVLIVFYLDIQASLFWNTQAKCIGRIQRKIVLYNVSVGGKSNWQEMDLKLNFEIPKVKPLIVLE